MFFAKSKTTTEATLAEIAVIGASAQAFFIADILQQNNCSVTILLPENQIEQYAKNNTVTFRSSGFQNHRSDFYFAATPKPNTEFVFLASSPESITYDMLLLKNPELKTAQIINLSSFYNRKILNIFKDTESFTAFLDGQFNMDKNTLTILTGSPKIEIAAPDEIISRLKKLLGNGAISLNRPSDTNNFFWQNFAPFFLGNLLIAAEQKSISESLKQPDIRKLTDSALTELAGIAKKEKQSLNIPQTLTRLYGFEDSYNGELTNKKRFGGFLKLLPDIGKFNTPALFELINRATKKY